MVCQRNYEQRVPSLPGPLPRFTATTDPSVTLSSSAAFRWLPGIRPTCPPVSWWDERASPVAQRVLAIVRVAPTPPDVLPLSQRADGHAAFTLQLQVRPPGLLTFGATCAFAALRPMTRHPPVEGAVERLQKVGFPSLCSPSVQSSGFYYGGLSPMNTQPLLDAQLIVTLSMSISSPVIFFEQRSSETSPASRSASRGLTAPGHPTTCATSLCGTAFPCALWASLPRVSWHSVTLGPRR